jgi:ring-1,2-phenylacetyl-CoA epoxidase subunit PaaB
MTMQFLRKYFYGDYDAIQGGSGTQNGSQSKASAAAAPSPLERAGGEVEWPLWEVFIRSKQGLDHKHVGSLHAADSKMAVENARDVYTRRQEGVSIWVVESRHIHASNPDEAESFYEPAADKVYRHPTFYDLPDELTHM